jgi:radical SAM superfamily enzyme YgiQ (UPF0313 family)
MRYPRTYPPQAGRLAPSAAACLAREQAFDRRVEPAIPALTTASKMPQLFADHADFVVRGEPEEAVTRLAGGETLQGICDSAPIMDLDSLPFPRWDLLRVHQQGGFRFFVRPVGGGFPLLSSRGCPEFCTYCPHRILAGYRARSVKNIVNEIEALCHAYRRRYLIFRDPLFT